MADELLRELAPLLAEEGIDASNIDVTDPDTLQQALGRAVERRNMAMFTPAGHARELAAVTMRLARRSHRRRRHRARSRSPGPGPARITRRPGRDRRRLHRARPRPGRPVAVRARHQRPARPGRADPAARRALDRGTRRPRHPHPGAQGTRVCLPRRADRPARRPARPLRQRPRPRRHTAGLGTTRRHPAHRASPHCRPLKPIRSEPSVASVATMAGIRRRTVGPFQSATASPEDHLADNPGQLSPGRPDLLTSPVERCRSRPARTRGRAEPACTT